MTDFLRRAVASKADIAELDINLSLRPAIDIQSNRLYDLRVGDSHWILKEYVRPDEFAEAPVREYGALRHLAPLDIAPQPLFLEPMPRPPHGPFVVYVFMEGKMWDRRRPTAAELGQLAELWLALNDLPTSGLWPSRDLAGSLGQMAAHLRRQFQAYANWCQALFPPGRLAATHCLSLLEARRQLLADLEESQPVSCFGRADARFANVIGRPDGRLGLVDWEDSGLRDPALDLADLMSHPNQEDLLPAGGWLPFLRPYLARHRTADPGLARRAHLYLGVLPLYWLAILTARGISLAQEDRLPDRRANGRLVHWRINGLPANQRLRRYLARALAWPRWSFDDRLAELAGLPFFPEGADIVA